MSKALAFIPCCTHFTHCKPGSLVQWIHVAPYGFRDTRPQSHWVGGWGSCGWCVRVSGHRPGSYLQDGPPALGCMLAAGWATPRHPMQGHVAVSAHTVGAVVVIDEAGTELGALPTNHLEWQVVKRCLIPEGLSLWIQLPSALIAFPHLHRALSEVGLQAASLTPP